MLKNDRFDMSQGPTRLYINPLLRIAGQDAPASQVLARALDAGKLPVQGRSLAGHASEDDAMQVDLSLHVLPAESDGRPKAGLGYAGLAPEQRYGFLVWAADATEPAALAFQQLYIANLEVRLFEDVQQLARVHAELLRLDAVDTWHGLDFLARALLLSFWLRQDGAGLADWIASQSVPVGLLGIALGCQGLMHTDLTAGEVVAAVTAWGLPGADLPADVITLRLSSLANALFAEPLDYVVKQLGEATGSCRPWRCAHRDLRIAIPQPDVRSGLQPLLADMLAVADWAEEAGRADVMPDKEDPNLDDLGWRLILEFGQSRSEFLRYVLRQVQNLAGYAQIMDENRNLVYRIVFKKSEMRRFWQVWDYVQNWSSTRVYLNGDELEKWKVWPYSQFLR